MALAKTTPFSDFVVLIRAGAAPPLDVLTAPCAFMARALNFNKTFQEITIPDCSDENLIGWINRDPLSMSWGVTGDGMMDEGSYITWDEWFVTAQEREIVIAINLSDATTNTYTGMAHLQTLTYQANRAERVMFNIEIVGDGPIVRDTGTPSLAMTDKGPAKAKRAKEAA